VYTAEATSESNLFHSHQLFLREVVGFSEQRTFCYKDVNFLRSEGILLPMATVHAHHNRLFWFFNYTWMVLDNLYDGVYMFQVVGGRPVQIGTFYIVPFFTLKLDFYIFTEQVCFDCLGF
jgi:hypothetical protein